MTIFKATKKPVTIEAKLWDGNAKEMYMFLESKEAYEIKQSGDNFYIDFKRGGGTCTTGGLVIKTSEGDMLANIGDYIIKEPFDKERKFYPCKPDIFKATYDF